MTQTTSSAAAPAARAEAPGLMKIEIEPVNRSAFLLRGVIAAGAAYGALAAGPVVRRAFAQNDGAAGDIDILNFALTLEYLEAAFYDEGNKQVSGLSSEAADLVKTIGAEEQDHVDALTTTIKDLGGKPVAAPGVSFGDAFMSPEAFLALAQTFEDTGVSAYNGAGPALTSKDLLAAAGSIVQVEARHAAAIRLLNGEDPAPDAFDPTLDTDEVLKAVQPFIN